MQTVNPANGSKTRREAAVLVFVVFLLGLLVGGVGNHLWGERVWGHTEGHTEAGPRQGPPPRAKVIDDLTRELQLTPDQQKQLGTIIDETRAQWAAEHEQIRQQGRTRIRAILTSDQQTKFEQFMQRIDEQRRKEQSQNQH